MDVHLSSEYLAGARTSNEHGTHSSGWRVTGASDDN